MADSNWTKHILSAALKELMQEQLFSKISIGDICQRCGMSRQSFYYHFKDKYDLVNWIYDIEYIEVAKEKNYTNVWDFFRDLFDYLYENKSFYRKILEVKGQNSLSEHFRDLMLPTIAAQLSELLAEEALEGEQLEFQVKFFTDIVIFTIERWVTERNCMPPEKFLSMLQSCVQHGAVRVCQKMNWELSEEKTTAEKSWM